jgi:hypothetical protein
MSSDFAPRCASFFNVRNRYTRAAHAACAVVESPRIDRSAMPPEVLREALRTIARRYQAIDLTIIHRLRIIAGE